MDKSFLSKFGWVGAAIILLAYGLLSFSIIEEDNIFYHLLNGIGALGIVISSVYKKDYPPATLNFVWMLIALFAIANIIF